MDKTNEQILAGAKRDAQLGTAAGIFSAISSLYSGFMGASTARKYGRMQKRAAEAQARLNDIATERNIAYQTRQTADQIADIKRQGRQVVGSQLAAMAETGMSTASGSAQALLRSTGYSVGRDISTLQANLINSAFEQRRQTAIENIGLQYQGQMAQYTARAQSFSSYAQGMQGALSAATSVAAKWNRLDDLRMINQATTPTITTNPTIQSAFNRLTQGSGLDYINTPTADIDLLRNGLVKQYRNLNISFPSLTGGLSVGGMFNK